MKQLALPDDIPGPEFIKFKDDDGKERWMLPDFATVARWREAQQAAATGDDKHALRQFRMATLMLEFAAQHAGPDDVVLMPSIGVRSRDDSTLDFETDGRFVLGADGGFRWKQTFDKFKKPNLTVVELPD